MPAPTTYSEVASSLLSLRNFYAPQIQAMNVAMGLYNLEITFSTRPEIDQLVPPTGSDIVKDIQDRIAGEFPSIKALAKGDRTKDREQAETLSQFLDLYFQRIPLSPSKLLLDWGVQTLLADMTFDGLVRTKWCLKVIMNPVAWPKEPIMPDRPPRIENWSGSTTEWVDLEADYFVERADYDEKHEKWEKETENSLPILVIPRDPRTVFPALDGSYVIEQYDTTAEQIRANWPDVKLPVKADSGDIRFKTGLDRVTWTEVWTDNHKTFYADQEVVLPKTNHLLEMNPYVIDGPFKTPMRHSGSRDMQGFAYESVYKGIEGALKAEAAFLTLAGVITQYEAFRERVAFVQNPETVDINVGPDSLSMLDKDDRYEIHKPGGIPKELMAMLQMLRQRIGDATGTSLLGDQKESGYARAVRAQIAKLKDRRLENALERSLERVAIIILRYIENVVKGPVRLTGSTEETDTTLKVGPSIIRGHNMVDVKLNAVLPIDEAQRWSIGQAKYDYGVISLETLATEYGGIRRPARERKLRLQEDVINSDVVKAMIEHDVVQKFGLPGSPDILEMYEQMYQIKQMQVQAAIGQAGQQAGPPTGQQGAQPRLPGPSERQGSPAREMPQQPANPYPGSPGEAQQRVNQSQAPMPPSPRGQPAMAPAQGQSQQRRPSRNRRGRRRRRKTSPGSQSARNQPVYSQPGQAPN
jgi:hypothetical protein